MRVQNKSIHFHQPVSSSIARKPIPCSQKKVFMFLVPDDLWVHFQFLRKDQTCAELLSGLINRYEESIFSGRLWASERISKRYQEEGLGLVRVGMKVKEEDLVRLGLLADYLGVSKCFLFSKLLELDVMGWGEKLVEAGWVRSLTTAPKLTLLHRAHFPKYKLKMTYRL